MLPAAVPVTLTAAERKTLKKRVRGAKTPYRDRLRAQIVLAAARGRDNERIAADLGGQREYGAQVAGPVRGATWPGWRTCPGQGARGGSARRTGRRR